jgi:alkaline phosphatase D
MPSRYRLDSMVSPRLPYLELVSLISSGSPSVATRNSWDIPLANFTVVSGENHLKRPVAGGRAESGALRYGEVMHTNFTLNTETGEWKEISFENMYLEHN